MFNVGYVNTKEILNKEKIDDLLVNTVKFSQEDYLSNAISDFNSINKSSNEILKDYKLLNSELRNIISKSGESVFSTEDTKDKIKQFFIKTWVFIVEVFNKFIEIIANLVRNVIIYIKRKRAEYSKNIQDKTYTDIVQTVSAYNNDKGSNEYKAINEHLDNIKFKTIKNFTFKSLFNAVNNPTLADFIKNCERQKTTNSVKTLFDMFKKEINETVITNSGKQTLDKFLTEISSQVEEGRLSYMISGDTTLEEYILGKKKSLYSNIIKGYKEITPADKHIDSKEFANTLVFMTLGDETIGPNDMSLANFLGGPTDRVSNWLSDYKVFNDKIFEYLTILEKNITETRKQFIVDKKILSEIKNDLTKRFSEMESDNLDKFPRIRTLTDIIIRIKNFKQDYLGLRQFTIINLLNIKNCVDSAFNTFIKVCKKFPEEVGTFEPGQYNTKTRTPAENAIF